MAYDCIDMISPDILQHDVLGALGCIYLPKRANLLCEIKARSFTEDDLVLQIQRYVPEGLGAELYDSEILTIPSDALLADVEHMLWDINQTIPPLATPVWILGVEEIDISRSTWDMAYRFSTFSKWHVLPSPERPPAVVRCLEMYAGAFGGWKSAFQFLGQYGIKTQTVGIELDEIASKAYAATHFSGWIPSNTVLPKAFFMSNGNNWIWQQDVLNEDILPQIISWQPHVITLSAPCPAWSAAGESKGLFVPGGRLFLQSLLQCRWVRPMFIGMEQVSNFHHHTHKHWILKALHMIGYRLAWQRVSNLSDQVSTARLRWLGLAVRIHDETPPVPLQSCPKHDGCWPDIALQFSPEERMKLFLTRQIVDIASDQAFVKTRLATLPAPDVLFAKRVHSSTSVFPTVMAMYGRQHEIDRTFLQKHGYLGHFVQDEHAPFSSRFLHPAEVAILHGCCNKVYIHEDMDAAWQHMGNMIAPPHAILVMTNVFQRMSLLNKHIRDIMSDFQDERLTSLNSVFTKLQFGGFVHRHNQTLTQEFVRNTVALHTVGTPAPGHIWTPEHGFLTCQQFDQHRSTKVTRHFELHPVESPTPDVSCMMTRSVYQTVQQSEDPRSTEPRSVPDQDANQEDLPEGFWSVSGLALHSSAVCPLSPMSVAESVVHTVNSSGDEDMHPTIDVPHHQPVESMTETVSPCHAATLGTGSLPAQVGDVTLSNDHLPDGAMGTGSLPAHLPAHHQPVESMTGTVSPCHAATLGTGSLPAQVGDVTLSNDHLLDGAMGTGSLPAHLPANSEDLCTARSTMLSNPITTAKRNLMGTGSLPAHEGIQDFSHDMGTGTLPAHEPYLARSSRPKNAECAEWYRSRLEHDTAAYTPADTTTDGTLHEALQTTAEYRNGQSVLTLEANQPSAATHESQLEPEKPISPISTATKSSDEGDIADTVPFQPVFKGTVTWLGYHEEFWFAADMPSDAIEAVWGLCNCTTMQQPHELIKLRLTPAHPQAWHQEITQRPDNMCLLILMDGELTLMKVEPRKGLLQQDHISRITETFYDQFGQVHGGQTADYGLMFLPQPLTHEVLTHELIYVFAAFAQVTTHWHRNKQTNAIIASFQGPEPAAALLRQIFAMALSPQSMDSLGRQIYYDEATGEIRFVPARNKGVAPPQPFLIALVVAVVRSQLDACKDDASNQPPILLKWAERPIWKGILHPKTTLGTMAAILKQSLVPLNAGKQYRLVVNGRQVPHDIWWSKTCHRRPVSMSLFTQSWKCTVEDRGQNPSNETSNRTRWQAYC